MATCYLAEIRPFTGRQAPQNWHFCDGSLLPIANYDALYSLLGTAFGGDGVSTFGLPDLRGRVAIGSGRGLGIVNDYTYGSRSGSETVTLTEAQMPAHTHAFTVSSGAAQTNAPSLQMLANASPNNFYATNPAPNVPPQVLAADSVGSQGTGQAHENRMPSVAVNYIIALVGYYPARP